MCARSPRPDRRPRSPTPPGWADTIGCCSRSGCACPSSPGWHHRPMALREVVAGTGTGLEPTDLVLDIGPQHPSTHGVLRLRLVLDGERIRFAEPILWYLHRGAEKLFE